MVLLDPLDPRLKALAAPLYATAASRAHEIAAAIEVRSRRLVEAGYHAQVTPSENSFPLFIHDADGARHALTRTSEGKYSTKDTEEAYTVEELKRAGTKFISEEIKIGAGGHLYVFVHPSSAGGVLVELCEDPPQGV